jgi:translation initiation factor 1
MSRKKINNSPFVYSTDPDFNLNEEAPAETTLPPHEQLLKVSLETKHRAGKTVTLVAGFTGRQDDLESLGKMLKNFCGSGGSAKDGEIIVQGDHREKVKQWLQKNKYRVKN